MPLLITKAKLRAHCRSAGSKRKHDAQRSLEKGVRG
jgi:hypothetical protein